ncbi:hypothetical protein BDK51DRAFT_45463 [Blyttiomyces helicus]|uniref:NAD(P)-binding domain-containing protein n=1 Tax=Blyttiomyces helicus TaxID=388810 RepID=A0A4P9VX10_9FUNG|nr:hypothetical protein BDK51DRAFT_45463 [Blyttiomyces helicus]|eukprot:RKO82810.1 hypothetical protein BDK51DRAFT_45463 [Blyttiomyces helicus]
MGLLSSSLVACLALLLAALLFSLDSSPSLLNPQPLMASTATKPIKLILTGATGTAGSEVLRQALVHPKIERVTVLSRRPLPPHVAPAGGSHPKLNVVIHENYESYPPELLKQVEGHDAVIWAQGISAVGFKEDAYKVITHDYPVAAAKAFATLKPAGGDKKLTYSFRPGGIVNTQPVPQAGMLQKAMSLLGPVLAPLMKTSMISTPDLANGMIEAVVRASAGTLRTEWPGKGNLGDENTFSNEEIKKLAQEGGFATKY